MARYSRIHLGPARENDPQVREAAAVASTLPGCLVTINGAGKFVLAVAASTGHVWLAQENYLAQKGVDAAYAADARVIGLELEPDTLYAGRVAAAANIADGAALTLAADGLFAAAAAGNRVVAYADEALNNTSGATALLRIRAA